MNLADQSPSLIKTLTLLGTSADPEPNENKPKYRLLNLIARWVGLWPVIGSVMPIMFGKTFLNDPTKQAQRDRWKKALSANHRIGITRAVNGVIARKGCADRLNHISIPVGIGVGEEDVATRPEKARRIHSAIKNAQLVLFSGCGHSSSIEAPAEVTKLIEETISRSAA